MSISLCLDENMNDDRKKFFALSEQNSSLKEIGQTESQDRIRKLSNYQLCHLENPTATCSINETKVLLHGETDEVIDFNKNSFENEDETSSDEVSTPKKLFFKGHCRERRLLFKDGVLNLHFSKINKKVSRLMLDIFTSILDLPWASVIFIYLGAYILSWLFFAAVWMGINKLYGADENGYICVFGVNSFLEAMLFSIETQHTIGYGTRNVTNKCTIAMFILMLQSGFGSVMQCIVTGIIFMKVARPARRSRTVMFSKNAVISNHNGEMYLKFRVGDIRKSNLITPSVHATLVHRKRIKDVKHSISLHSHRLKLTTEVGDDEFFLIWPVQVLHKIDKDSPLWNITPRHLLSNDFEIIVMLEASCEVTGASTQVRTSYLPSEILWGQELAPIFAYEKNCGRYKVDFSKFHSVSPKETNRSDLLADI